MTVEIQVFSDLPLLPQTPLIYMAYGTPLTTTSSFVVLASELSVSDTVTYSAISQMTGTDLVLGVNGLAGGTVTSYALMLGPPGSETTALFISGLNYDASGLIQSQPPPLFGDDVAVSLDATQAVMSGYGYGPYGFFYLGGSADDLLRGASFLNTLYGQGGDDVIFGGAAGDNLNGGAGNDLVFGGSGNDSILGEAGDDQLSGEDGDDFLIDVGGNNTLDGGAGNDFMAAAFALQNLFIGGLGNDTIIGSAGADWYAAQTLDTSYTLAVNIDLDKKKVTGGYGKDHLDTDDNVYGQTIENAYGGAGADKLTGTMLANRLAGGKGDDTIKGGAGADILGGMAGKDVLSGGAGKDKFVFANTGSKHADHITDYDSKDVIILDKTVFAKLSLGALSSANFHIGTEAADKNDFVVYDKATGKLFYDKDGDGHKDAVLIATIDDKVALTAHDFKVVASTANDDYWFV